MSCRLQHKCFLICLSFPDQGSACQLLSISHRHAPPLKRSISDVFPKTFFLPFNNIKLSYILKKALLLTIKKGSLNVISVGLWYIFTLCKLFQFLLYYAAFLLPYKCSSAPFGQISPLCSHVLFIHSPLRQHEENSAFQSQWGCTAKVNSISLLWEPRVRGAALMYTNTDIVVSIHSPFCFSEYVMWP